MDDVAALCPRVIVIDKGTLSFDGKLDELVQKVRPEKRVTLRFSQPVSREQVAPLGQVVTCEGAQAVLQVSHDQVNSVVGRALSTLPVMDSERREPAARRGDERALRAKPGDSARGAGGVMGRSPSGAAGAACAWASSSRSPTAPR
jgi:ABC-type multidrug transport system ATPase subunit